VWRYKSEFVSAASYRRVAWKRLEAAPPLDPPDQLEALASQTRIDLEAASAAPGSARGNALTGLRVRLDGVDVTEAIRRAEVSQSEERRVGKEGRSRWWSWHE